MPSTEAYLGSPYRDVDSGNWCLRIDDGLRTNLDSICELCAEVLDAQSCLLYAKFPEATLRVAAFGETISLTDGDLALVATIDTFTEDFPAGNDSDNEATEPTGARKASKHRIILPISMSTGRQVGWLILIRISDHEFTDKEHSILSIVHRDVRNHLLQSKRAFETATSQSLQELITHHNEDFIFVKDEDFRIVYANTAFLNVYPPEMRGRVIGFTTVEEYDEKEAELFLEQDRVAFEKGLSRVSQDLRMPDGRRLLIDTVKRRFEDEKGKRYILGVARDITEREQLIQELKEANDELSYFTSIASHDLKSPLNAIRRLLDWIQEDCAELLPEEHLENMRLVSSRADRMQALLDDLLAYARIGEEDETLNVVSLKELCEGILDLLDVPEGFIVSVQDKSLQVNVVPFQVTMLNLIGNAIKHNDNAQGRVDVTVGESLRYYTVDVADNGPGIDPKYFGRIFELFQTLKPRDEVEGTGIGLSVVMKYVTKYGGKIAVLSDGSSGSTFRVSWPKPV